MVYGIDLSTFADATTFVSEATIAAAQDPALDISNPDNGNRARIIAECRTAGWTTLGSANWLPPGVAAPVPPYSTQEG